MATPVNQDKLKVLNAVMEKIEKDFGKGSIMRMNSSAIEEVAVIPSGSITLDMALGVGGYPGTVHADAKVLIHDEAARKTLMDTFKKYDSTISAIAVHGNCVHPNKTIAAKFEEDFEAACVLAGQIGIKRLVTFSGCPGGDPKSQQPNWVTCA